MPVMDVSGPSARLAHVLYRRAFPVYRVFYEAYKVASDRAERGMIRRLLRPGDVAVDIGANIGSYARFMSRRVGPNGKVFAFEPSADNFERLVRTVGSLGNVEPIKAAVGNATGPLTLYESDELNVDHRAYDPGGARRLIEVDCYRLDDYFEPGQRVDFVKMDIQGFEYQALQGMRGVLEANEGITLLLEYWPLGLTRADTQPHQLIELLAGMRFHLQYSDGNGWRSGDPPELGMSLEDYSNILARR